MRLELNDVCQAYGKQGVLKGLSLRLESGELGCLLGQSASGKTTVLRCIAGFEALAGGQILAGGKVLSGPEAFVPPEERHIAMVFQDYALFPHLTVRRNVSFGLHQLSEAELRSRLEEVLERFRLIDVADRYPHEISGGQQQRVAVARAVAPRPGLILLDEPFSNLDTDLRVTLSREVRQIFKVLGTTALMVTHDQNEAFAMADKLGVIETGGLAQWDTPYNLYHRPATRFVAGFIGEGVMLPGVVQADGSIEVAAGRLRGELPGSLAAGDKVEILLRPDDVVHDKESAQKAVILERSFRGAEILYTLQLNTGAQVMALIPSHVNYAKGETIGIRLAAEHVVVFAGG